MPSSFKLFVPPCPVERGCKLNQKRIFLTTMFPPKEVEELLLKIGNRLRERKETVAISESACGGLISAYIVSIPGASKFLTGSTLAYSVRSRLKLSGWSEQDILQYTGPSEEVALKLARNLRLELGSTYVLSETGWAGPEQENEPVGDGYFAVVSSKIQLTKTIHTGCVDRSRNMELFAKAALEFLWEQLE